LLARIKRLRKTLRDNVHRVHTSLPVIYRRKARPATETEPEATKPKRRFRWSVPSLPTIPFVSFLWNRPPLSWIRKFPFRQTFGVLGLLLSALGLLVIFKNPMPWIGSYLPLHITTPVFQAHLTEPYGVAPHAAQRLGPIQGGYRCYVLRSPD
jgi:hypothetical protein